MANNIPRDYTNGRTAASLSSNSAGLADYLPQSVMDAADAKIASWSTAIVDTADTIERLVSSESLPIPETLRDLAKSTTNRLRSLGTAAGEQQAAELVGTLQRSAAAHPAASIGIGAAIGAALATLLVRLNSDTIMEAKGTARATRDRATASQEKA